MICLACQFTTEFNRRRPDFPCEGDVRHFREFAHVWATVARRDVLVPERKEIRCQQVQRLARRYRAFHAVTRTPERARDGIENPPRLGFIGLAERGYFALAEY